MKTSIMRLKEALRTQIVLWLMHDPASQKCHAFSVGRQPKMSTRMLERYSETFIAIRMQLAQKNALRVPIGMNIRIHSMRIAVFRRIMTRP